MSGVCLSLESVALAGLPVRGEPGVVLGAEVINGDHLVIAGRLQLGGQHLGALQSDAASKLKQCSLMISFVICLHPDSDLGVPELPGADEHEDNDKREAGDHQAQARYHLDMLAGQAVRGKEFLRYFHHFLPNISQTTALSPVPW